jgi:hypothetical protein
MFETMASFTLVEHANGAMFDPRWVPAIYPRTVAPSGWSRRARFGVAELARGSISRLPPRRVCR